MIAKRPDPGPWIPTDRQITWLCNGVLILFGAGLGWALSWFLS